MKKILLSFIVSMISLAMIAQTYDVTISGVVTNDVTGAFVPNHEVVINADSSNTSSFRYYNVVTTNDAGFYQDIMQVPTGDEGMVEVSTQSCNTVIYHSDFFSGTADNLVFDFQICGDPATGDCEAMYYYYPTGNIGEIQFTDVSMGDPTFWTWDFGDGETSIQQNPVHTYAANGEYIASLTISSQDSSCFSYIELMVRVTNDSILPNDCEAMFYYFQGNDQNTVNFIDESYGYPTEWAWDFGDGNTSVEQNPVHVYTNMGEYLVTLSIVADSGNCTSTFQELVFVYNDTISPGNCQAMFFAYGDSLNMLTQNFIDMSTTINPSGTPDSWYWDFGDGNSSTEQNPTYTYAEEGDYEVCLTITVGGDINCESTECQFVRVGDWNQGCYTWYEYEVIDLTVDYMAFIENGGVNTEYTWDFGDGTTGTGENVSHTYAEEGMYTVLLTTMDNDSMGCFSQYIDMVWVGDEFTFEINGIVYLNGNDSTNITADYANVYLMTYDTVGNGLINIATTQTVGDGYYEFEDTGLEHCMYFVQAELTDQSAYADDYVPTYHFDALNWENASPVFPLFNGFGYDVYMIEATSSNTGNGTIAGTVSQEGSRELLSNITVLLLNEQGQAILSTRTNDAGMFSFGDLELGTYVVYTEIVGIETIPFNVVLSDQNNTSLVGVIVKNGQAVLGIDDINSAYIETVNDIFPNPVTNDAKLSILVKESSNIKVEVLNQYGQHLFTNTTFLSTGKHNVDIPSSTFAHGMYFVKVTANDNISTVRKFIKVK